MVASSSLYYCSRGSLSFSSSSSCNCFLNDTDTQYTVRTQKKTKEEEKLHHHHRNLTTISSAERRNSSYLDFLWKEYFRDPSQWWDYRNSKTNPRSPDFKHKLTKESLWIGGWYNPCWVPEELRRRGLQPLERSTNEKEEGDTLCVVKKKKTSKAKGTHYKAQQEEEEEEELEELLIINNRNHQKMQEDTGGPHTLVALLKACAKQKDLHRGSRIHADIVRQGLLEKNVFVGNSLVSMYVKCGSLAKAQEVCDELPVRNVVSWNALITGYAQHGHGEKALHCFEQMQLEGLSPNAVTFACILKACGSIGAAEKGQEIHAEIVREGLLEKDIVVGTALVDMYAKCGSLAKAQEVFDKLPGRDVVSWNALIAGYAQHGHGKEALNCFERMQLEGLSPNAVTFVCIVKACGSIGAADKGQEIHAEIVREGFLEKDVANALVDMYAKCGMLAKAQQVFDQIPLWDVVSWNALIAGYAQHGHGEEALNCFERMQVEGFSPDAITFVCILKACGSIGAVHKGQEIHAEIVREGLLEKDIVVGKALVDMYAKCGLLAKAQEVFDKLPVWDVVLWNVLIAEYAQYGHGEEALNCFERMQLDGLSPNALTFVCMLKACVSIGAADKGQEIHAQIVREGLLEKDMVVGTALVDMYAKCGSLAEAQEVFDKLPVRDVVSWSALIAGYAQHGHGEEALNCFERMQHEGFSPNAVTLAGILKACGSIGAADKGQEIHAEIIRERLLERDIVVGTALVDMYAKCGLLAKAQEVFDKLPVRNVVSWSALIAGYAQLGKAENVFYSFDKMIGEGIKPDLVTFTIVLNTCSHTGLLDKGQMYFETMSAGYGIAPTSEHHTCMVDLFGRAGHLDKAVAVIKEMPFSANLTVWHTVLGACRKWGNMKLGRLAFEHAVQLDEKDAAAYVCMSNIYADAGRQEDAHKVEAMRVKNQAWKNRTLLVD